MKSSLTQSTPPSLRYCNCVAHSSANRPYPYSLAPLGDGGGDFDLFFFKSCGVSLRLLGILQLLVLCFRDRETNAVRLATEISGFACQSELKVETAALLPRLVVRKINSGRNVTHLLPVSSSFVVLTRDFSHLELAWAWRHTANVVVFFTYVPKKRKNPLPPLSRNKRAAPVFYASCLSAVLLLATDRMRNASWLLVPPGRIVACAWESPKPPRALVSFVFGRVVSGARKRSPTTTTFSPSFSLPSVPHLLILTFLSDGLTGASRKQIIIPPPPLWYCIFPCPAFLPSYLRSATVQPTCMRTLRK